MQANNLRHKRDAQTQNRLDLVVHDANDEQIHTHMRGHTHTPQRIDQKRARRTSTTATTTIYIFYGEKYFASDAIVVVAKYKIFRSQIISASSFFFLSVIHIIVSVFSLSCPFVLFGG